ncbi:restriction endonuclease subunit S [Limosilactobacillus fermentum]|uniref:restriction endonuclease subunit S n=2 Tax=Bacillati TaxID=1783272 RepID=UPI0038D1421A
MNAKQAKYPQLRFKGYTDPWEQRKLKELANIVRGASPRPIQDPKWFDDTSEVGWLRIADVTDQNGRIHHLEQRISALGQEKTRVLATPHLLLSIAATVGKPVVNYVKTGVHDGFLIFEDPKFDREFMFQWLEMFRPMWQRYGQPGSQVNLNSNLVKNQGIILPSMEEQHKIGSFFKQLDHLITLHQRKLAKLKELKQGYLQKMFPRNGSKFPQLRFAGFTDAWEQRKFSELFQKSSEKNTNLSFSRSQVLTGATMTDSDRDINSDDDYMKTYNVIHVGDILFEGHTSKQFAFGRFVLDDYRDGIVSHVFDIYRPKAKMNLSFWKYYIHDENVMRPILVRATSNARMLNALSSSEFLKQSVFVPSENEQAKIGNLLEQIDSTIALHQRKLEKLQELKKGYLQKMFV